MPIMNSLLKALLSLVIVLFLPAWLNGQYFRLQHSNLEITCTEITKQLRFFDGVPPYTIWIEGYDTIYHSNDTLEVV
ncbi:MAG: hypothetical protein AAFU67_14085, partial [Bacteroidota bacterium]